MSEGHGTGYEDAITRKIAAADARAKDAEAALERERAQTADLVKDNARLRTEAAAHGRQAGAARVAAILAWVFVVILLAAALAAWFAGYVRLAG
jgi:hypothetical protein